MMAKLFRLLQRMVPGLNNIKLFLSSYEMQSTMNSKLVLIIIFVTISSVLSYAQEIESVLSAPDNWKSEIIPFPLGFAPTIDFIGFEDLRFLPNWTDSTSQEFWTYTFVWYIEKDSPMTESKLTESFNAYYDGLMGVDLHNQADSTKSNQLDKTRSLFVKNNEGFTGEMRVYDRFFTKDYMVLNIKVKEIFCPNTNKQIIFCDISPKLFDHAVWNMFDDVKLKVECN